MTQEDKKIITDELNRRLKQLCVSSSMQADNDDYYRNPLVKQLKELAVFVSNIKESEIPNDLEEAAEKYAYGGMPDEMKPYVKPVGDEVIKNFIAGAEWQKEQDNAISRQAEAERIKTQQMCYEKGQADMKWQMMQEAVEGEVTKDNRGNNVIRAGVFNNGFEYGDKVRVFICKKEDEK